MLQFRIYLEPVAPSCQYRTGPVVPHISRELYQGEQYSAHIHLAVSFSFNTGDWA